MIYQFKIHLKDIYNPIVWRRVLVPSDFTFVEFHEVIQVAFGWENSHMFFFSPKGYRSNPIIEMDPEVDESFEVISEDSLDAETTLLSEIFISLKQKFTYIYDYGDDWNHQIMLEKILMNDEIEKPVLLNGEGACPPEDCGGPWGYDSLKKKLADKKHPDHKDMKEWMGLRPRQNWDAAAFELEAFQQYFNEYFSNE
jgi:hypothetical protein